MKIVSRVCRASLIVLMGILLIICVFFAVVQTKGFKKRVQEKLSFIAREAGFVFTIGSIEGDLPFQWTLHGVHLELSPEDILDFDKVIVRVSFLPLLRNELAISYCSINRGKILYSEETLLFPDLSLFSLPFHFSIRTFKGESLLFENFQTKETGLFSLRGQGKLKKRATAFFFNAKLYSETSRASYVQATLKGDKEAQSIQAGAQVKMKSAQLLRPFLSPGFETDLFVDASLQGSWKTWEALFASKCKNIKLEIKSDQTEPLRGLVNARINKLEANQLKILNRRWLINTSFSLRGDGFLNLSKFALESNLVKGVIKAEFNPSLRLKTSSFQFLIPKLEFLSLYLPVPLQGSLEIDGLYTGQKAEVKLNTDHLYVGSQSYETGKALFQASLEEGIWKGQAELMAREKNLLIEGRTTFTFDGKDRIAVDECFLTGPDTKIAGNFWIDLSKKEIDGALFGQLFHLSAYRNWAPLHSGIEGTAAAYLDFKGGVAHLHLLLNNFHYFKTSAEAIVLDAEFAKARAGKLSLEATNFRLPQLDVSSFGFHTEWAEENAGIIGPYRLFAKGGWKEPFEIHSQGKWTQHSLSVDTLKGYLLKQAFNLEKPFFVKRKNEAFEISECSLVLGQGDLKFALELHQHFAKGYLKARHFPLDLFFISHPSFSLRGMTSIDADIQGNEENMRGRLNVLLEQFDLYQCGKSCPLKAKGSLEANLDHQIVQLHADLKASPDQLFEATATLPLNYTLFPLTVKIDPSRSLSAEMTLEGKLEEIFDFINIGSHHVTGLLSCHLLLAKTLASPSLQGTLELQKGTYENYYTGTSLKDIRAKIQAQGDHLTLAEFEAKDDQGGKANARGELWLNFAKKLPYSLQTEIANLNLLRFDSINGNFTGDLSIAGTSESALASGGLIVNKADLSIPEELPVDLPVLPITYINRPAHLDAKLLQPLPVFPFNLDLALTAPGPIYVRGRGLRSEWKGNAQISGTNTDVAANGSLTLTKGEFIFSGKGFNLTQGEISLTAKPNQTAYLKLRGELQLSDVTIIALLNGPLTSPLLTFQSIPHMPTSSLLSRILFNKDISEISPIQALQLAQTIVTLSGGAGPDVLEKIRKSLGVDRLNIVSGQNGSDQVSVQIGKYLTKGVMVTLSQGVDSSQIIVEVELKHGFLLQAETQEDEEGKFSLKWNKNY
jgi:translocation and assembly module TamB